ncbi:hypothetical protein OF83DRAFT_660523 [Amylostereum chailletii]|nr:hypothetical protein OF83DRAFT_660523 [Amylostereum chailletii]
MANTYTIHSGPVKVEGTYSGSPWCYQREIFWFPPSDGASPPRPISAPDPAPPNAAAPGQAPLQTPRPAHIQPAENRQSSRARPPGQSPAIIDVDPPRVPAFPRPYVPAPHMPQEPTQPAPLYPPRMYYQYPNCPYLWVSSEPRAGGWCCCWR